MRRKTELRRATIALRDSLSVHEIRLRSAAASSHLLGLPEFQQANTVMFFVSFGSEIATRAMIEGALAQGKRVVAPRADPQTRSLEACEIRDPEADLAPGAHDISEPKAHCRPAPLDEVDVVIVPAAVWGEDGYRVGYGGGYYDRFLARVPSAVKIGLGLEMQLVPEVPRGEHDLPVDILVTDAGVRRFRRGAAQPEGAR